MHNPLYIRRLLGVVLLGAFAVLAVIVIRFFTKGPQQETRPLVSSTAIDVALRKIHFVESDSEARRTELFASSGEYDKVSDKTTLQDIIFEVERSVKGDRVKVTARRGEFAHASKNVNLAGEVLALTADGTTLETPRIAYVASSRELSGRDRVKLTDAALTVEGTGFVFNIDRQELWINSDVTATVTPASRNK